MSLCVLQTEDSAIIHLQFKCYMVGGELQRSVMIQLRMRSDRCIEILWVEALSLALY